MTSTWMPLSIGDYLKNTQHLSTEEHGAYLLLIMHYWINGPIKNDKKTIKNITKINYKKCENILCFFSNKEGYFQHERIDEELLKARDKSQKAKDAAGARWGKAIDANASTKHMPQPYSSPSPPSEDKESSSGKEGPHPNSENEITTSEVSDEKPKKRTQKPRKRLDEWIAEQKLDGIPAEWRIYAQQKRGWNDERINTEAESFWQCFTSEDCKEPLKRDWPGAWQRWIIRAYDTPASNFSRPNPPGMLERKNKIADFADRLLQQDAECNNFGGLKTN